MPRHVWGSESEDGALAARDFATRFTHHCHLLGANPEVGQRRDDLLPGLRRSSFDIYSIFYRLRGDRLEVLRILGTRRDAGHG